MVTRGLQGPALLGGGTTRGTEQLSSSPGGCPLPAARGAQSSGGAQGGGEGLAVFGLGRVLEAGWVLLHSSSWGVWVLVRSQQGVWT